MTIPVTANHIFISYSRRDEKVMRRILMFLRNQGINVWVDNEKLVPGTPVWEEEIEKAIRSASAIVVVLSPDSKKSLWVRREISFAENYNKRIFPILVAGDEDSSITLRLITNQYVDIRQNEKTGLTLLSSELLSYLNKLKTKEKEEQHKNIANDASIEKDIRSLKGFEENRKLTQERINIGKENELPPRKRTGYPSGTDPITAKPRGIGPARNKQIEGLKKKEKDKEKWITFYQTNKRRGTLALIIVAILVPILWYLPNIDSILFNVKAQIPTSTLREINFTETTNNTFTPTASSDVSPAPTRYNPTQTFTVTPNYTATPGNLLFFDDFEGEGKKYNFDQTTWKIAEEENNKVLLVYTNNKWVNVSFGSTNWKNYSFEFDFKVSEIPNRVNDSFISFDVYKTNLYWVQGTEEYAFFWRFNREYKDLLYRQYNGPDSSLFEKFQPLPEKNHWYHIKVEVLNNHLTGYIDNVLRFSAMDTRIQSGAPGFTFGKAASNTDFYFDNIRVESLE